MTIAPKLVEMGFISRATCEYLCRYATGGLDLPKRPAEYAFLGHRWDRRPDIVREDFPTFDAERGMRGISIRRAADYDSAEDVDTLEEGADDRLVALDVAPS